MLRQLSVITIFFLFSSTGQAFDKKCFDKVVARFNHCSRNAHDKASRGNFKTLRRRTCENELIDKAGECFGSHEITRCERRAGEFFIKCQSRENQKFIRGNIGARHTRLCMGKFQDRMQRCEEAEATGTDDQVVFSDDENDENSHSATTETPVEQTGETDVKTASPETQETQSKQTAGTETPSATTAPPPPEVDRRLLDE